MITLLLCGDVMTGRGIDQILPRPGDPVLHEPHVRDARYYVRAAARRNGSIEPPVPFAWPWGFALQAMAAMDPDASIINLETSITRRDTFAPGKAIHYRMHPDNLPTLLAARPDVCVLANNHVLDFGRDGLTDTIDTLTGAGIRVAGAGPNLAEAARPAIVDLGGGHRLLVFAAGTESSGVPAGWAAGDSVPGVYRLPDLSENTAAELTDRAAAVRRPGDVVVFSLHWGSNWGYRVPGEHVRFARWLAEGGAHIVHGHSSHHPRPIEVVGDTLILYGCGDLINDYEGIAGFEDYRDDLRLLYFPILDAAKGTVAGLRMLPVRARRLRLHPASADETLWLRDLLTRISGRFGTRVVRSPDGLLSLRRR